MKPMMCCTSRISSGYLFSFIQSTGRFSSFHLFIHRRMLATQQSNPNHYESLGVGSTATSKEIKSAFYQLSKRYHPDVNPTDKEAAKKFSIISNAYDVLSDPVKRRDYDNELMSSTSSNVMYDRTSSYSQRARAHRPSAWKPPSSSPGGFPGSENAFGSSQYGTFDKERYDAAFGRYRGPTPSGRTNIYDFDEFYRSHYDFKSWTTMKKEAQEKQRRDRQAEEEKRQKQASRSTFSKATMVGLWIGLGIFLITVSNVLHDMHFQNPKEEFHAKFYLIPKNNPPEKSSTKT